MAKHRRTRPVNPAHPGAAVFAALWGCVALPALVVGGFALGGVTPSWPTPVPTPVAVQAPCDTDAACAAWDTYVAQDVYGVAVWANDPARTPHAEDRGHGRAVLRLSCPQGGALADTDEGAACVAE